MKVKIELEINIYDYKDIGKLIQHLKTLNINTISDFENKFKHDLEIILYDFYLLPCRVNIKNFNVVVGDKKWEKKRQ